MDGITAENLHQKHMPELRGLCKAFNIPITGLKDEVIVRLINHRKALEEKLQKPAVKPAPVSQQQVRAQRNLFVEELQKIAAKEASSNKSTLEGDKLQF